MDMKMTKLHGILTIHCQEQFINKLNNYNLHTKPQQGAMFSSAWNGKLILLIVLYIIQEIIID